MVALDACQVVGERNGARVIRNPEFARFLVRVVTPSAKAPNWLPAKLVLACPLVASCAFFYASQLPGGDRDAHVAKMDRLEHRPRFALSEVGATTAMRRFTARGSVRLVAAPDSDCWSDEPLPQSSKEFRGKYDPDPAHQRAVQYTTALNRVSERDGSSLMHALHQAGTSSSTPSESRDTGKR